MVNNIFALFLLFLASPVFCQQWIVREVGTCPNDKTYGICVGNGRNDGINRIYVTTRGEPSDAAIYEWTWSGTTWVMTSTIATGLKNLITIAVGEGRNDNVNRLYAVEWGGTTSRVFEYSWNGTAWVSSLIQTTAKPMLSVTIGDARGDGTTRVYVDGWIIHREYTWNGSGWNSHNISLGHGTEGPIVIGKGRNDGQTRYYVTGNHVKEYTWTGTNYQDSTSISIADGWPETVVVSELRNDGQNRVLTQDNNGVYEYTWNGTSWQQNKINGRFGRSFLFAARPKSDCKLYVYNTDVDSAFREYRFNEQTQAYIYSNIDAATGATALIDAGNGRNDDTIRLYTPRSANGKIYELTYSDPYVLEIPPEIDGDNMLCPESTGTLSTGNYETYQWYRRYYGSSETLPIEGATEQTLSIDYENYAASYLTVEVTYDNETYISDEFFVDGYAFLPPVVETSGEFTIGTNGQTVICPGDEVIFTLLSPYNTNIVWYYNIITILEETGPQLVVTIPGLYYVVGAPEECPNYVQGPGVPFEVIYCDQSNIDGLNGSNQMEIYPNPADDRLYIASSTELKDMVFTVTDQLGRQVLCGIAGNDGAIDVSSLQHGLYYLHLVQGNTGFYKFIKH